MRAWRALIPAVLIAEAFAITASHGFNFSFDGNLGGHHHIFAPRLSIGLRRC
jgi:hypothetical protein